MPLCFKLSRNCLNLSADGTGQDTQIVDHHCHDQCWWIFRELGADADGLVILSVAIQLAPV